MSIYQRKYDTRRKIQMGGLVIKAGLGPLHDEDKAILLGILVDAAAKLGGAEKDTYSAHYKELGERSFSIEE